MQQWFQQFTEKMKDTFGSRIVLIGIQGSYGRGEQTERSDIDVVLILDSFTYADFKIYDAVISEMTLREKLCGFVSGKEELLHWDKADLFQLYHDTTPLYGEIEWIGELIEKSDIQRAIHQGACNIYHMCVHNAIHEKSETLLRPILKSAVFLLQAKYYDETGKYISRKSDMASIFKNTDLEILKLSMEKENNTQIVFEEQSKQLMCWASRLIIKYSLYL